MWIVEAKAQDRNQPSSSAGVCTIGIANGAARGDHVTSEALWGVNVKAKQGYDQKPALGRTTD